MWCLSARAVMEEAVAQEAVVSVDLYHFKDWFHHHNLLYQEDMVAVAPEAEEEEAVS